LLSGSWPPRQTIGGAPEQGEKGLGKCDEHVKKIQQIAEKSGFASKKEGVSSRKRWVQFSFALPFLSLGWAWYPTPKKGEISIHQKISFNMV
jgi:hypothetical protein